MDDSRGPRAAERVRESATRADDLTFAALSAKLPYDFDGLRDARCADRLPAGLQPARCVHGNLAVQRGEAVRGRRSTFPLLDEPQVLDRENLRDREVVVDFRDLDVFRVEP